MNMRSFRAALLIGLACSCVSAGIPASVDEQIDRLAPDLKMVFSQQEAGGSGELGIRRFGYVSRQSASPYGEGFAVWSHKSSTVLWLYLHDGDFPPHQVHWADFDGNRPEDLFFYAGFEDVATTHLYLNRIASDTYGVSQFARGYSNDEVYATVVDMDGNGRPELLVPDRYFDEDDPCASELHELEANNADVQEEYRRLANGYGHFNFDSDLFLFRSVQVISVGAASGSREDDEPSPLADSDSRGGDASDLRTVSCRGALGHFPSRTRGGRRALYCYAPLEVPWRQAHG